MVSDALRPTVLLVEPDLEEADRLASWLEPAGFNVTTCPGPSAADYACVGTRRGSCPLAAPADVVIIDGWLWRDSVVEAGLAERLVTFYAQSGKPVVVLSAHPVELPGMFRHQAVVVPWPCERDGFTGTVWALLGMEAGG